MTRIGSTTPAITKLASQDRPGRYRATRLGNFIQEADGFASQDDAARWVAQHRRIAVIDERKEPMITSAHLRVVPR